MLLELSREDEIAAFINDVLRDESAEFKRRLISALSRLGPAGWDALEQLVEDMARSKDAADQAAPIVPPGYSSREELEAEADEFAAMAREQFLLEKRQGLSTSSANGSGDLLA